MSVRAQMSLPRLRQRFGFVNDDQLSTIKSYSAVTVASTVAKPLDSGRRM